MKRHPRFEIVCLILLLGAAARSWAVWPPETALEAEANPRAEAPRTDVPLDERLENDEHRLQSVLQDLKQDEQELRRRVTTSSAAAPAITEKEN